MRAPTAPSWWFLLGLVIWQWTHRPESHVNAFAPFGITPRRSWSSADTTRPTTPTVVHTFAHRATPTDEIDDDDIDDATLLQTVPKSQLVDLCTQLNLRTTGSKPELLARLRQHAQDQRQQEMERRESYEQCVQDGFGEDAKERYELVSGSSSSSDRNNFYQEDMADEDEEEDLEFVILLPDLTTANDTKGALEKTTNNNNNNPTTKRKSAYLTQAAVTAPPIPDDLEPNQDGERVVTTYSTLEQNDLTGVTASQPGYAGTDSLDAAAAASSSSSNAPWDMEATHQKSQASTAQVEQATQIVTELVQALLATSGAPVYRALAEDHLETTTVGDIPNEFVGFDPSQVPPHVLTLQVSQALRTRRGQVLADVLRQFEITAIGQDGAAGDNKDKGGGHYREVSKVGSFLEGYRRAQVRKQARETTTLLLDKLVQEGVEGLDMTLGTMTRSSDDTSEHAGELNDSLLDYLNDAIRQQEKKVDQLVAQRFAPVDDAPESSDRLIAQSFEEGPEHHFPDVVDATSSSSLLASNSQEEVEPMDAVNALWNVTTEDGQRIESIDPNDPLVKSVLEAELEKQQTAQAAELVPSHEIPETAPEKLLLLLSLLKERIKAEAAFAPDEKGRNLRLLAYCMRLADEKDRAQLLMKDMGNALDRLDSFIELVESSVEYGDSTSYQLQPAKTKRPLNVALLKQILKTAKDIRSRQGYKASAIN